MKSILVLTLVYILFTSAVLGTVENTNVVVIGAGAAGITALRELTDGGQPNVVLLEADCERYGGRINTVFVPGYSDPIELGASFFHDSNYNPTIALAQQAGMTFEPMDFNSNYAWKDGRFLNINQRTRIYNNYLSVWAAADPYYAPGLSYADVLSLGGYDFDDRGVETLLMTNEQTLGVNLEEASANGVTEPPGDVGQQMIVTSPGGYKQFLDYLLDSPTNVRSKLRLGSKVTKIDLSTPSNKLTITYVQGGVQKQIVADKVIVTVSMGVLKAGTIQFVPPLPAAYQGAIDRAAFGNVNKGFLFYSSSSATAQKLASLPVNIFYKIAVGDNPRYNDQLTYFYNNMYIKNQPSIQSFYVGNYSKATEQMTDSQVLDLHRTALNFLVSSNNGNGNNNNVNNPTPLPLPNRFIRSQWGKEENIRGSYTTFGVSSVLDDFLILNKGISNKLYFAGEHVLVELKDPVSGEIIPGAVSASIGCVYTSYLSAKHSVDLILGN